MQVWNILTRRRTNVGAILGRSRHQWTATIQMWCVRVVVHQSQLPKWRSMCWYVWFFCSLSQHVWWWGSSCNIISAFGFGCTSTYLFSSDILLFWNHLYELLDYVVVLSDRELNFDDGTFYAKIYIFSLIQASCEITSNLIHTTTTTMNSTFLLDLVHASYKWLYLLMTRLVVVRRLPT